MFRIWTTTGGERIIPKKRHTAEQIIGKLREAEVFLSQEGRTPPEASKQGGISEQTSSRWTKGHGGPRTGQVRRLEAQARDRAQLPPSWVGDSFLNTFP